LDQYRENVERARRPRSDREEVATAGSGEERGERETLV
jgi:hypothetical protein